MASASICRTRASVGASGRVIGVGLSAASKKRTLPSQFRKVPAFSATAATGRTTSACSVTSPGRSSSDTRKPTSERAARARAGSEGRRPPRPPPPGPAAPRRRRPRRSGRCRARSGAGARRPAPGGRDLLPRARVGGRTPARQQRRKRARLDRAALPRPGAGSTPAWRRSRSRPVRAGGEAARHTREPLADDDHRTLGAQRLGGPGTVALQADAAREGVQPLGRPAPAAAACRPPCPGRVSRTWRARTSSVRVRARPCAAAGRLRAPPPRTRSRRAGRRAPSPRGVREARTVEVPSVSGDPEARKSASSALCTRARKSMSFVSRATRANLL